MTLFSQRGTLHAPVSSLAKLASSARRFQIEAKSGLGLIRLVIFTAFVILAPVSRAQNNVSDSKGINEGNYNIQQTAEFGYRGNWINGNENYGKGKMPAYKGKLTDAQITQLVAHIRTLAKK